MKNQIKSIQASQKSKIESRTGEGGDSTIRAPPSSVFADNSFGGKRDKNIQEAEDFGEAEAIISLPIADAH